MRIIVLQGSVNKAAEVEPSCKVRQIFEILQVPGDLCRVYFGDKLLDDHERALSVYGVKDNSTLTVTVHAIEGGIAPGIVARIPKSGHLSCGSKDNVLRAPVGTTFVVVMFYNEVPFETRVDVKHPSQLMDGYIVMVPSNNRFNAVPFVAQTPHLFEDEKGQLALNYVAARPGAITLRNGKVLPQMAAHERVIAVLNDEYGPSRTTGRPLTRSDFVGFSFTKRTEGRLKASDFAFRSGTCNSRDAPGWDSDRELNAPALQDFAIRTIARDLGWVME